MININYIIVPLHRANLYSSCGLSQDLRRYDGDHGETKLFSSWARSFQPQFTNITMCVCVCLRGCEHLRISLLLWLPRKDLHPGGGEPLGMENDLRTPESSTPVSRGFPAPFPRCGCKKPWSWTWRFFGCGKKGKQKEQGFSPNGFSLAI